ncbi:hypothetical protein STEG23_025051, partial [Scotinomys teguina]
DIVRTGVASQMLSCVLLLFDSRSSEFRIVLRATPLSGPPVRVCTSGIVLSPSVLTPPPSLQHCAVKPIHIHKGSSKRKKEANEIPEWMGDATSASAVPESHPPLRKRRAGRDPWCSQPRASQHRLFSSEARSNPPEQPPPAIMDVFTGQREDLTSPCTPLQGKVCSQTEKGLQQAEMDRGREAAAEGRKAASMRLTLEMLEMDQRAGQKDWFPRS